jgi:hypothetical protein
LAFPTTTEETEKNSSIIPTCMTGLFNIHSIRNSMKLQQRKFSSTPIIIVTTTIITTSLPILTTESTGILDTPVSLKQVIIIITMPFLTVLLFIFLSVFCYYKKSLKNMRILDNNLRKSLATLSLNILIENQLADTKIHKLNQDIQTVNRIIKLHERLIKDVETDLNRLFEKSGFSVHSSKSDIMADSTIIQHDKIGSHFILDGPFQN